MKSHSDNAKLLFSFVFGKRYVHPFLLDGRKFDIRVFALIDPQSRVYLHQEGRVSRFPFSLSLICEYLELFVGCRYAKTCTMPFDMEDCKSKAAHLTNDAVQIHEDGYGAREECNKLSFDELDIALSRNPTREGKVLSVSGDIWPAITRCAHHVFRSAWRHLSFFSPPASFELFGMDFLVDRRGQCLLLEARSF